MIRIIILLFLLFSSFTIEKPKITRTMYFMIGKDSKVISYDEFMSSMLNRLMRVYEFKNVSYADDPLQVYIFMTTGDRRDPFDTIIKPRRFLDSIQYYDEEWLINKKDLASAVGSNRNTKYYVIDTSAMHNDTVKLYRCNISVEARY